MTNFKLFGYTREEAKELKKKIRQLFMGIEDNGMAVTTIPGSEAEALNNKVKCPYIEVADSDKKRGLSIAEKLSRELGEDIELTLITKFFPTNKKLRDFEKPKKN